MKKLVSLTLALIMLTALSVPTTSFAALQYSANLRVNLDFSKFTTKNQNEVGDGYLAQKTLDMHSLEKSGTAADYEPVKGLFGKAADDTSVKVTRIRTSAETSSLYIASQQPGGGTANNGVTPSYYLAPGDDIVINWNWAFGDMYVDRSINGRFYKNDSGYWGNNVTFNYNGNANDNTILKYSPNGMLNFFGTQLSNPFYAELNKWYNFEVRITNGNNSTQTKCNAKLYIDGIPMGNTDIYSTGNVFQMNGIYWLCFRTTALTPAGSTIALPETTYIDDVKTGYFQTNAAVDDYVEFHQSFELTSKSDAFVTDKIHISLKDNMTVDEFGYDVSYNGKTATQTGITEVKVLKEDWSEASGTDIIQSGWYARIKVEGDWRSAASRNVYRYYYRKFTDSITYYKNDFEGSNPSSSVYGLTYKDAGWGTTNTFSIAVNDGLKSNNNAYKATSNKVEGSVAQSYVRYYGATCDFYNNYVIEASVMRQYNAGDYPSLVVNQNGMKNNATVIEIDNDNLYIVNNAGEKVPYYTTNGKLSDRWFDIAYEINIADRTAKIYLNGNYTGVTRTIEAGYIPLKNTALFNVSLSKDLTNGSKGSFSIDNFKVYSGAYKAKTLDITSVNNSLTPSENETITVAGDISINDFKAATNAVAIYSYTNGTFGNEITSGNIVDGYVAVFENNEGVIRYLDIELLPLVSDVAFKEENDKVVATVTVENRNAKHILASGILVVANRSGDEVFAVNLDSKEDIASVGVHTFKTDVAYNDGDNIVAYFWDKNLKPFENSKAIYTK